MTYSRMGLLSVMLCTVLLNTAHARASTDGPFTLLDSSERGLSLRFELPDWSLAPVEHDGVGYSHVEAYGAEWLSLPGYPPLPVYTAVLAVPPGAVVSSSFSIDDRAVMRVAPLEPAPSESSGERDAGRSRGLQPLSREYREGGAWPASAVVVSPPERFRDYTLVRVTVNPFSYDPSTDNLSLRRSVTVSLGFSSPTAGAAEPLAAPGPVEPMYRGLLLNWQSAGALRSARTRLAAQAVSPFDRGPRWAAVRVDSSDIYAVSGSGLIAAGVNLDGAPPASLRLFTGPGRMLDEDLVAAAPDLHEVAVRVTGAADGSFDPEDRIIFYAQGLDRFTVDDTGGVSSVRNRYNNHAVYWLSWGDPAAVGLRMAENAVAPSSGATPLTSAERWFHFERNTVYFPDLQPEEPKSDPVPDYWAWVESGDGGGVVERSFDLPQQPIFGSLRCQFYGSVADETPAWRLRINGAQVVNGVNYSISERTTGWTSLAAGTLSAGANAFSLEGQNQVLGFIELRVEATLTLGAAGRVLFHRKAAGGEVFQISEDSPRETEVYDLTDPVRPVLISGLDRTVNNAVKFAVSGAVTRLRSYAALTDSTYARPYSLSEVVPAGLKALSGAEYLIVSPRALAEPARALAALHASDYSTRVVALEDIYDEFSLGQADPAALRNFLKYAYDNWPVRPRFAVLFGDGHNDWRGYSAAGRSRPNRITPYITSQDLAVEEWFVRFASGGLPQIALGRLPVQQVSDAATVVDKIVRYGEGRDPGDWVRRAILVADDGYALGGICDIVTNHVHGSEQLDSLFPEDVSRKKVYLDNYPFDPPEIGNRKPAATRDLLYWWNRGALLVNYLGHGSSTQWAQELVFDVERDLPMLNNGNRLPLVLNSSCSIGHFDDYSRDAMAERLVTHAGGGAIAVYAGTRVTYAGQNLALNRLIVENMFNTGGAPMGEAALLARLGLGNQDRGNAERYGFFGDPGLRLHATGRSLKFSADAVSGLKPGQRVDFSGEVEDFSGVRDASFSGVAEVRFESGASKVTIPYQCDWFGTSLERQVEFNRPGAILFDGTVTVSGGRFSGAFVLPVNLVSASLPADSTQAHNGRFAGYSTSENLDASGAGQTVQISGQGVSLSDSAGPRLTLTYRGRELRDGDRVGLDQPLVLNLQDESGINTTGGPGYQVSLEVDQGTSYAADLTSLFRYRTDSYQEGSVDVDLSQVGAGLHSFRFRAADNALNPGRIEMMLYVSAAAGALSLGQVLNYPNPFRDETDICFELSATADVLVRIFSVAGRPVRELRRYGAPSGFNMLRWDGKDEYQQKVANGVYLYKIICKSSSDAIAGTEEVEATGKALLSR